jgi:hypothetical protein
VTFDNNESREEPFMNIRRIICFGMVLAVMLTGLVMPVWADRGGWSREDDRRRHERFRERERQHSREWVLDRRYNHNHYYPRHGYVLRELPSHHRIIRHRNTRYYFDDGIWYRAAPGGFVVVTPPFGLVVPLLPPFYTTVWAGGFPYYYSAGIYYRWLPEQRAYVVSEPPPEQQVVPESEIPRDLFIYPKQGQSREQQDSDRYECHRWSVEQTGFDPSQPGGNVSAAENAGRHVEYQRAMKACLEARGYSVQ